MTRGVAEEFYRHDYWPERLAPGRAGDLVDGYGTKRSREIVDLLAKRIRRGARILGVGCGKGGLLRLLVDSLECRAVGIDPGLEPHEIAALRQAGVDARRGEFSEALFAPESFDLILLVHVLEHLHDPGSTLAAIRGLLATDGLLFVEVPNMESAAIEKRLSRWLKAEHLWYFSPPHLATLACRAGFQPLETSANGAIRLIASVGKLSEGMPIGERVVASVVGGLLWHEIAYWGRWTVRKLMSMLGISSGESRV